MNISLWRKHFSELLPSPRVVIDAGANTGQTLVQFRAQWPAAEIHCIEPVREAFSKLERLCRGIPRTRAHRLALAEQNGVGVVYTGPNTTVASLLPRDGSYTGPYRIDQQDEVEICTLDAFFARNELRHVDLLKMDLQGGELLAIDGAARVLAAQAVDVVLSEIWLMPPYDGAPRHWEIAQALDRYGYSTWWIEVEPYPGFVEGRWGDAVFISPDLAKRIGYSR